MDTAIVPTAECYRDEAARARHIADMPWNADVRQMLLEVADQYELLARVTERNEPLLSLEDRTRTGRSGGKDGVAAYDKREASLL